MNAKATTPRRVTGQTVRQLKPKPRQRHYVRNTLLTLLAMVVLGVIAAFTTFLIAYATTDIPKPSQFAKAQVTSVYYADGTTPIGKFAEVNREIIDTTKLPKYVGNAVVASEDRTFWTNSGVDLRGIVRAFVNNVRGGSTQGASTLSQQYVERYYMSENTSEGNVFQRYWKKAEEAIMALKINKQQDKEQILDNYLNTIYFGRGAYGIQAAARAYFDKPAKDLSYSEAALLAGIIPAPSSYDPAVNSDMASQRWKRVIQNMATDGYITPKEKKAAAMPQTIPPMQSRQNFGGVNGYFMFQVRQELKDMAGLTEEQIDSMGLKVVTSIDKDKQQLIMDSVAQMPKNHSPNLRVAMISTDPKTGEIVAEYPGSDYLKVQVNAATQDHFQAGSSFKPFGLIAHLEKGGSLTDTYSASSPASIWGLRIQNFGNASYGTVTLAKATALSLNVPYVKMNSEVGPSRTKEVAIRLGYPEKTPGLNNDLTNVLGSASPTAADIATAYGTIANAGVRKPVHMIRKVTDNSGDIVYIPSFTDEQVLDRNIALTTLGALQGPFQPGGTAARANIGRDCAGKTGSSSDNKSAVFVGLVPQMLTVVSLYQVGPNGTEESITPFGGYGEITGSTMPAWLWKQYMSRAVKDLKPEKFDKPTRDSDKEVTRSEEPETSIPPTTRAPQPPAPVITPVNPTPTPTTPTPTPTPTDTSSTQLTP